MTLWKNQSFAINRAVSCDMELIEIIAPADFGTAEETAP